MEIESADAETSLDFFIVFDIIPPKKEGALPSVYWYYSTKEYSYDYIISQTGLIMTFAGFCRKFKPSDECDYIFTNKREISIGRLYGNIFMAVSLNSTAPFNRYLLQSILRHSKIMFSHFWVPLPDILLEGEEPPSTELIVSQLDDAFKCIVQSIDWDRLDFSYLFNSYTKQGITGDLDTLKQLCAQLLLRNQNELTDIAILYRKHRVVHTTFSATVTRALAFGMRKRFGHLFLHNPRADSDQLTWIIGAYTDQNGIPSFYQPVIYIGGVPHLLVAFKLKHFKIVLTLNPNMIIEYSRLNEIPGFLKELRQFLKLQTAMKPIRNVPVPFAAAIDQRQEQQMYFECSQIDAKSRQAVDVNIIRGHQAAVVHGNLAAIAFLGIVGYYCYVWRQGSCGTEKVAVCKYPTQYVSDYLRICRRILETREKPQKPPDKNSCEIA